jgi:hypothetical protein
VRNQTIDQDCKLDCITVSAAAFLLLARKAKQSPEVQVFSASMADIKKALAVKKPTDPRTKLSKQYYNFLKAFDRSETDKLPLLQGPGIDYRIKL